SSPQQSWRSIHMNYTTISPASLLPSFRHLLINSFTHSTTSYHPIIKQEIIFSSDPNRKPTNDPSAARRPCPDCLLAIISPKKAPINGPSTIPQGGTNIPTIRPMVHPHIPYLLPPNLRVL